jgi:hypothetical protein
MSPRRLSVNHNRVGCPVYRDVHDNWYPNHLDRESDSSLYYEVVIHNSGLLSGRSFPVLKCIGPNIHIETIAFLIGFLGLFSRVTGGPERIQNTQSQEQLTAAQAAYQRYGAVTDHKNFRDDPAQQHEHL